MATQEKPTAVLWEELDFRHVHPVRTAVALTSDGSDVQLLRENNGRSLRLWASFAAAFLPEGYPDSVTSDYLSFQFWDTLQGLSTYIRSMLSTQALLSGIGVGQTAATVMGATFQWFMRDFTGMLGGIIFTIYQGSNLDSKAKQWRLAADFMNDIGMLLDLISPLYPKLFVTLLCIGSIARSVTGVASGATRAALTQHFALQQNAADISAKEGSQETAATLSGMLLGMLLANITAGHTGVIWACFLALTCFHMFANYKAVRSLCLTSLNKERANIVLTSYLKVAKVPSPMDVSSNEVIIPLSPLWLFGGKAHKSPDQRIVFGAKISSIDHGGRNAFSQAIQRYSKEKYLLFHQDAKVYVVLHKEAKKEHFLKAYIHATVAANFFESYERNDAEVQTSYWMEKSYGLFMEELQRSGWNVNRVHVYPENWRANWYPADRKSD